MPEQTITCKWNEGKCPFTGTIPEMAKHLRKDHGVTMAEASLISSLNSATERENNGKTPRVHKIPAKVEPVEIGNIYVEDEQYGSSPMLVLKWHKSDDKHVFRAGGRKWEAILALMSAEAGMKRVKDFVAQYQATKRK